MNTDKVTAYMTDLGYIWKPELHMWWYPIPAKDNKPALNREQATLIYRQSLEARRDELKKFVDDSSIPPDCSGDCTEPDPHHPSQPHWHHVVHRNAEVRLAELNQDLQELEV